MSISPDRYLRARYRAAKAGLLEIWPTGKKERFQETRDFYYHYLQGMRDMAFFLGCLDEEENHSWMQLILKLYYCTRPEEIEALPDDPSELSVGVLGTAKNDQRGGRPS